MKYVIFKVLHDFWWFPVGLLVIFTLPLTIPSGAMGMFIVLLLPYILIRYESRRRFRNGEASDRQIRDLSHVPQSPRGSSDCVFTNAHKILIRQNNDGKYFGYDSEAQSPISSRVHTLPMQVRWEITRIYPNALIIEDF